jgi:hypothetical protein
MFALGVTPGHPAPVSGGDSRPHYADRMRWVALSLGLVGTVLLLVSFVRSMLILRGSPSRARSAMSAAVDAVGRLPLALLGSYRRRDRWLATVAPVAVLLHLTLYAIGFVLALGLLVYGTSDVDPGAALYQSGATFTTLGIVGSPGPATIVVTFVAAFLGLVVIAVFIGYLLAIYGMYSAREAVMARWSVSAGEPAWGPEMLARAARLGHDPAAVPDASALLDWLSQLRLNTQVAPILGAFRSTTPHRHWVVTLLAMLDAVSLRLALGTSRTVPADAEFVAQGAITLTLLVGREEPRNWSIQERVLAASRGEVRDVRPTLEAGEWAAGWAELTAAGLTAGADADAVRARFETLRVEYFAPAHTLARRYHAVRAPWSGDRAPATPVVQPIHVGERSSA